MTSSLVALNVMNAAVPKLHENELPLPHFLYGIIAFCIFLALLGVVWSFRNTARRMTDPNYHKRQH